MKTAESVVAADAGHCSGFFPRAGDVRRDREPHPDAGGGEPARGDELRQEARRRAILKLGGVERTRQAYRERDTLPLIENLLQDLRFAFRQLVKNPGFAVTAILILTLGIAASVALFAFVDAALLKPLPYAQPNRLMAVYESGESYAHSNLSYPDYLDWKRMNKVFQSLAGYQGNGFLLKTASGTEPVRSIRVSDDFFRTLGVAPMLGRDFYAGEDLPSGPRTTMLSYATWQHRFGGRSNVIGEAVSLGGMPYTIVGVLPKGFSFAPRGDAEFWTPFHAESECDLRRSCHGMYGVGRLKDGVTVAQAQDAMQAIAKQLERMYPGSNHGQGAAIVPLSEAIVGTVRPILLVLLGGRRAAAADCVRECVEPAAGAGGEPAARDGGARRAGCVAAAAGAAVCDRGDGAGGHRQRAGAGRGAGRDAGADAPDPERDAGWDAVPERAGAEPASGAVYRGDCGAGDGAVCGDAAGAAAHARAARGLSEGGRGAAGTLWRRLGSNLVMAELAIAMVLLAGAGLLGKSLYRLLHVEIGFQPENLATLTISGSDTVYGKAPDQVRLARGLVDAAECGAGRGVGGADVDAAGELQRQYGLDPISRDGHFTASTKRCWSATSLRATSRH